MAHTSEYWLRSRGKRNSPATPSEREAPDELALALSAGPADRDDGSETARELAERVCLRRRREAGGCGVGQDQPIEGILPFHPDLQGDALLQAKGPAEVHICRGMTKGPVIVKKGGLAGAPLIVGHVGPRRGIQHVGFGRIEAVAVDIDGSVVNHAVGIGPVRGPQRLPGNTLRRARTTAQNVADGIGAGRSGQGEQCAALILQVPAGAPIGEHIRQNLIPEELVIAMDPGNRVFGGNSELVGQMVGRQILPELSGVNDFDQVKFPFRDNPWERRLVTTV